MKQKILFMMLLLIAGIGASVVRAQSLVIKTKDGKESIKRLCTVHKFNFTSSNMLVNYTTGTTETFGVSTISKLYFKADYNAVETLSLSNGSGKMVVYPNPANSTLSVSNLPEGNHTVLIYRIDGSVAIQTQISPETNSIDVAILNRGLYLLKVNNQVFKFKKL
jgi:hypothetical protein